MNEDPAVINLLGLIHSTLTRIETLLEQQLWECKCGTMNSVSLTYCRLCKRREGEDS